MQLAAAVIRYVVEAGEASMCFIAIEVLLEQKETGWFAPRIE